MSTKLSQLKPGQKGVIREIIHHEIQLKLMEMGCLPGEPIAVEQVAPLGDPVSIQVAGYRLSLRLDEAEKVLVDIID
ncbi:MAG: ferrous iron transport protein A [Chitinophagaceae bacterium]